MREKLETLAQEMLDAVSKGALEIFEEGADTTVLADDILALCKAAIEVAKPPTLEQLRDDDAELHPWGEPGGIPDDPKVWVLAPGIHAEPFPAEVVGYAVHGIAPDGRLIRHRLNSQPMANARYRRRSTPEAPR